MSWSKRFSVKNSGKNSHQTKWGGPIFIDKHSKVGALLLHGFSSTPYQFKELGAYLASKGWTVYAPVIAGHGTSPEDMMKSTAEDWKKSVKEAYQKLGEKCRKIIIVGNSFGGNLSFWLAKELNNTPAGIVSLGTPVSLKFQWFLKLRMHLYGWAKEYYRKPPYAYKTDYTDMADEVTYPVIPVKSIREFFRFLKNETIPNLDKVKVPTLIIHATTDPLVHPDSATYIHQHLGSSYKKIYLIQCNRHVLTIDARYRREVFQKIYDFIREII